MQDDITWGVKHLVKEGIADPKKVAIMGGSYGGYATLAGVAFTPDVYAAGVSIVGPSNLLTLLETIPPYWEAIRIIFHERMGNPNTPEGKKLLEAASPLNSATKIKTPLLVVQGANDPRVKKAESDQIVIALRDRGFPVEYICAPDEGHGFARPVNNMAMMAASEAFLAKHLGGRRPGGRDARGRRPPEGDHGRPEDASSSRRRSTRPPSARRSRWPTSRPGPPATPGTIAAGPQTMQISSTRVVKEEGSTWVVTDTRRCRWARPSTRRRSRRGRSSR